jgi:hypothetical protein
MYDRYVYALRIREWIAPHLFSRSAERQDRLIGFSRVPPERIAEAAASEPRPAEADTTL